MDKKFFKTKKTFLLMILTMSPVSLEARIDKKREKGVLVLVNGFNGNLIERKKSTTKYTIKFYF